MVTPDTRNLAEEALRRAEKATPGPWLHFEDGSVPRAYRIPRIVKESRGVRLPETIAEVSYPPDRDFIAHARSDVPALADTVLRLMGENESLGDYLADMTEKREEEHRRAEIAEAEVERLRRHNERLRENYELRLRRARQAPSKETP